MLTSSSPAAAAAAIRDVVLTTSPRAVKSSTTPAGPVAPTNASPVWTAAPRGIDPIYAQGPSHRWHLWILDVDDVRVVVQAMDYAGTSPQRRAELQAIVDSIRIEP